MEKTLKTLITREEGRYVAFIQPYDIATQGETFDEIVYNVYECVNLYLDDEDLNAPEGTVHYSTKETIPMNQIVQSLTFDSSAILHYASYAETRTLHTEEELMAV